MSAGKGQGKFAKESGLKVGVEIWRIENLNPVPVPPASYGTFYSGDCYILLKTFEKGKGQIQQDLHFWLGNHSSQDEQGGVAFRAVELDDQLGGKPTQHREVQGHESSLFLSYFPKGIVISEGGVDSAFRHVDATAYQPRLFHVKGKRTVRCNQVELSSKSLNQGDVFILDLGLTLYQWNGSKANKYEKFKGLEIVTKIKDQERGGKAHIVFLESGADDDANFWKVLGPKSAVTAGADDDDAQKSAPAKLFRISDASGSLSVDQVGEGKLTRSVLDSSDVFLLDSGTEIYVWIGKGATKEERNKGMPYASQYLAGTGRPNWTPITRVAESGETPVFKSYFNQWEVDGAVTQAEAKENYVRRSSKIVSDALYNRQKQAEEKIVSGGEILNIWRIENFAKAVVDKAQWGHFYAGDSYIILFHYKLGSGKDAWIIFYWQGRDSSLDEKAASAKYAVDLDNEMGGDPVQVRVVQNKEPGQFLQIFQGNFIVHDGGVVSGFHNRHQEQQHQGGPALYHVKGASPLDTHAVQVQTAAGSLNSGDSFVLLTEQFSFLWFGKGSSNEEREFAKSIAPRLAHGAQVYEVNEGEEPQEFWDAIGGQGEYASGAQLSQGQSDPRLFSASGVTGDFVLDEVHNFSQDDLQHDTVYILDVVSEVYVWIGNDARTEDKQHAIKVAMEYVLNAPDGRSSDTPVYRVAAGSEPPTFTANFLGWSYEKASDFSDPYATRLASVNASQAGQKPAAGAASAAAGGKTPLERAPSAFGDKKVTSPTARPAAVLERVTAADLGFLDPSTNKFPLTDLAENKAGNINKSKKEDYLSDADFAKLFAKSRDEFTKLPQWKKDELKKKHRLF